MQTLIDCDEWEFPISYFYVSENTSKNNNRVSGICNDNIETVLFGFQIGIA